MKNYIIIGSISLLTLLGSCTDSFDDTNSNPNFPEDVTPELLMINILHKTSTLMSTEALLSASGLSQYITAWDFNDHERYVFSGKTALWTELYYQLRDVENMIYFAEGVENDAYVAIGMIMKAYLISNATDLWGDVPFSEAIKAKSDRIFTAVYDEQEQIYTGQGGILELLKNADQILAGTENTISSSSDIFYEGDLSKWRKFANSLRLRYLLRISDVYGSSGTEMQSIVNGSPVFENNLDNASLPYLASSPNQYPLFTVRDGDYNLMRMTNTIEQVLENLNDSRMDRWFKPADSAIVADGDKSAYHGMPVGLLEQTRASLGFQTLNHVSRVGSLLRDEPDGMEATLMNYAELQFILAEAAHKGLISGGEMLAEEHYNNGVLASLLFWQVDPTGYLAQPEVAYDPAFAMERIIEQKWLANFLVGYEGWYDFRRTGLPVLPEPLDNANNGEVPSRYFYPNEEQLLNTKNWEEAVTRMGGKDDINIKVWWEN